MRAAKNKLYLGELATALDDAAALAEVIVMVAGLANEDEATHKKLPAIARVVGRLLEQKLLAIATKIDATVN